VNKPNELQSYVAAKSAGTKVVLTVFRDGKEIESSVTLKSREEDLNAKPISNNNDSENKTEQKSSTAAFDNIGLTVKNISDKEKADFKVEDGVMISDVKSFSKAEDQNLFAGLVIVEIDKEPVYNINDFSKMVENKKGSAMLMKVLDRQGNARFVGLEIPE
jgi:serine protease Do